MTSPTPWVVETDVDTSVIYDDVGAVVVAGTPADQAAFEEIIVANNLVEVPAVHPPIGTWHPYGGLTAPDGYIFADGSAVSRVTYQYLYAVYQERFGAGDGIETFNVPNMSDRVPKGKSGTTDVGDTGGSTTLSHSGAAVGAHSLNLAHSGTAVSTHSGTAVAAHSDHATDIADTNQDGDIISVVTGKTHGSHVVTQPSAHTVTQPSAHTDSLAHSVTQPADHASVEPPYLVCNYIIRCW